MKPTIMVPINYRFKTIYMINQKKKLFRQQVPESTCGRNITTDTDILSSWNGNRNNKWTFHQSKKWSQFSKFT